MRRNRLVWFVVGVVIVISILLIAMFLPLGSPQNHVLDVNRTAVLDVNRTANSPSEEQTLTAAETIDYANIVSLDRFYGPSEANAYINPGSSYSYTWANFIDSEVVDYYQNRYDYQQKQLTPKSITFTYNAKATYLEQLHIFNITQLEQYTLSVPIGHPDYPNQTITWKNITIVFQGSNETTLLETMYPVWDIFYKNQTTFNKIPLEFDLTFNNCYLIEMNLTYGETYNPVAGFFVSIQQIVVLDQNFEPLWVGITPPGHGMA